MAARIPAIEGNSATTAVAVSSSPGAGKAQSTSFLDMLAKATNAEPPSALPPVVGPRPKETFPHENWKRKSGQVPRAVPRRNRQRVRVLSQVFIAAAALSATAGCRRGTDARRDHSHGCYGRNSRFGCRLCFRLPLGFLFFRFGQTRSGSGSQCWQNGDRCAFIRGAFGFCRRSSTAFGQ